MSLENETFFKSIFSLLPVERFLEPGCFQLSAARFFFVLTLLAPTMGKHKTHVDLIGAISFY